VSGHAAATADHSTMNTDATVSTAAFIAGGVLIVGGVGLFLSSGRVEHAAPPPATSLMFAPSFGVGSAGLSLTGKF
jgi:hypothetical protein